jgi:hypothetical protein
VSVYVVARQWLSENLPASTNTWKSKEGRHVIFHVAHFVSKRVCDSVFIPAPLLGIDSVNTLLQQQKIVGGIIFYALHIIS